MTILFQQRNERADWHDQPAETVMLETDAEELPKVLEAFERFLRGAGYCFKGSVTIEEDET